MGVAALHALVPQAQVTLTGHARGPVAPQGGSCAGLDYASAPVVAEIAPTRLTAPTHAAIGGGYKVIVLDRMLPGGDGVEAMARIRAGGSSALILILSALGRAANRVEGLEKGADDYLPKPFEPDELRARLRALLRRGTMQVLDNDLLAFGDLEIRMKARTVHVRRAHVAVSPKEFELITYFARNAGQVVTLSLIHISEPTRPY